VRRKVLAAVSIIIIVLGLTAGIVWVLDRFAVIDAYGIAKKVPVAGKLLPEKKADDKNSKPAAKPNPLEEENRKLADDINRLKEDIGKLEKQVETANTEKNILQEEKDSLKTALETLRSLQEEQEGAQISYESIAKYYAEMKPDAAVKIMNNLSEEVNIGILQYLEDEQVAAILSAMDPVKAADLVDKMSR